MRLVALIASTLTTLVLTVPSHASTPPRITPTLVRFWDGVQRCEEPGTGWRTRGSEYEGGVGFYVPTWRLWAGQLGLAQQYPHAYMAPPLVQMEVAEWGWQHGGFWGTIEPHSSCAGWHP